MTDVSFGLAQWTQTLVEADGSVRYHVPTSGDAGLGTTWTTLHLVHEHEVANALGIPEDVTQTVLLPVGYTRGAVLRPAARRPAREVTYWNDWGSAPPRPPG